MSDISKFFAAACLLASGATQAATVTQCGPNVCYEYDNAQTAVALTGLPTLVGDSMQFLPPAFIALSSNNGIVTTTANWIFSRVYTTNALNEIISLTVSETFDYEIINGDQVRAALYTQAASLVQAGDFTNTNPIPSFIATGDSGGPQVANLVAVLNPAAAFTGMANNMSVNIQNTLRAITNAAGEEAFIQKKFMLVTETLDPVPVPGAVWLLGSALGLMGWLRRRAA